MIDNFKAIEGVKEIGDGAIICMYDRVMSLDEKNRIIPYQFL